MKNKLIKTQFVIMLLIILGKVIGFLRESILASKYGTGYEVDVYGYSINILLFLATIGYSVTTILIPIFTELKEKKSKSYQIKISNNLISVYIVVGAFISIFSIIFSKYIVNIFAPGFEGEILDLACKLVMIINTSIITILVQSVISGILQAYEKFYEAAAMALAGNIIVVLYLLLSVDKFGIIGFSVIIVISYFIQLLINIPSFRKLGFRFKFSLKNIDDKTKEIIKLSFPVLASTCIMQFSTLVNIFFGSLIGTGSISIYNYANRIINLGIEIFSIGISMAIYPILSKMSFEEEKSKFNKSLEEALVLMVVLILPIIVLLIVLRSDVVKILYERNEFTSESTIQTSKLLLLLIPTMLASGIRDLLSKACYSLKEVNLPMKASILTIIMLILFNGLLYKKFGAMSLGISSSIATILGTLIIFIVLKRKYSFIKIKIRKSLIKVIIICLLIGGMIHYIREYLLTFLSNGFMETLLIVFICGTIGLIIYILLIYIFNVKELEIIKNKEKL
ncbi:murein biosynthesis integral membrane protein MurJ [Clostridium isatidis]|uniref:Lipid II flippase n=1 Tax=Clostridium isatidis TaxID=182773 RepID=A0A343JAT5_9CLOT|nr:murein biosynthesis integral membrane protein MurJ [Clostridium isatidis]ASW42643.1 murein biosynthesis integral membrane protein MurJ [Clostridium isatidis]